MPVDKFPDSMLAAKQAGHSQGQCHRLISAPDFGASMLYLDDASKTIGYVIRRKIYGCDFAVSVVRGGCRECFYDLLPTPRKRSERIPQSDVVRVRKQRFCRLRISAENRCHGCVAAFNGTLEVAAQAFGRCRVRDPDDPRYRLPR
jgi:hypothetical protein